MESSVMVLRMELRHTISLDILLIITIARSQQPLMPRLPKPKLRPHQRLQPLKLLNQKPKLMPLKLPPQAHLN
jgi:hypothetical protein